MYLLWITTLLGGGEENHSILVGLDGFLSDVVHGSQNDLMLSLVYQGFAPEY